MTTPDTSEADLSAIEDDLLPTSPAAEVVGVTAQTLRRMEERGKITAKRGPNGERFFSTHDCLRLAASGEDEIFRSSVTNPLSLAEVIERFKEKQDEKENYITADEAVIKIGVSRATLRRWELKGKVKSKHSKYTKHVLFKKTDVNRLVAERRFQ
jgi:DNA-binding transcriptional MerR regulator